MRSAALGGSQEIRTHSLEVPIRGLERLVQLSRLQRVDDAAVVELIGRPPFARVVSALEVAPELTVASRLDRRVHPQEEAVVPGHDERVVQRQVPRLELLAALGGVSPHQAALHLVEVAAGGVGDDEGEHLGLEELTRSHHVGWAHVVGPRPGVAAGGRVEGGRGRRAQERASPHLSRDSSLGLEHPERVADRCPGDAEILRELPLRRQARTDLGTGPLARTQDQLGQLAATRDGLGGGEDRNLAHGNATNPTGEWKLVGAGSSGGDLDSCRRGTIWSTNPAFHNPIFNQSILVWAVVVESPARRGLAGGAAMRLATVVTGRGERLHVRRAQGYVDVASALGEERYATLQAVLEDGRVAFDTIGALAAGESVEVDEADFGPAVPSPRRVLCLGMNYREHALEGGRSVPTWPEVFVRGADSVLAPYGELVRPVLTESFDFEGELGVVIGRGGRYIPAADALDAVAGFVVLNDGSAREWQRAATQWTAGKNFDGTMPIGPELVTTDEIDIGDLELTTRLNGEVMQSARTSQMILDVPSTIEFCSSFTTLRPGDVIATGTPGGVGFARKPQIWLTPGDVIEVTIEGIGTIRNTVVAEHTNGSNGSWRWHAPVTPGATL